MSRACPGLGHLENLATGPIILKGLLQAIQNAPIFRSSTMTRTRRLVDVDMNADWDHSDQLDGRCRFLKIGSYFLLTDGLQKPRSVRIHETGVNNLGRRYTHSSTSVHCHGRS